MIRKHFENDLVELSRNIMKMGLLVQKGIFLSTEALTKGNENLARQVIEGDKEVNTLERELCDSCALMIAREQPVAGDLRHLISGMKIITDIERIGDHNVHLAKGALALGQVAHLPQVSQMAEGCASMLEGAVRAFLDRDSKTAYAIAIKDEEIDRLHKECHKELMGRMLAGKEDIERGLGLLHMSRFLERMGDHVKNICEWVVFDEKGEHEDF